MASRGSTRAPRLATAPLTLTRPPAIHCSMSRREPRPARARTFCSFSPLGRGSNSDSLIWAPPGVTEDEKGRASYADRRRYARPTDYRPARSRGEACEPARYQAKQKRMQLRGGRQAFATSLPPVSARLAPTDGVQRQQAHVGLGLQGEALGLAELLPGLDLALAAAAADTDIVFELADLDAGTLAHRGTRGKKAPPA